MSKLSFRARALDATKPMAVYRSEEIPDLPDFAAINRAVPQMPTGMEKEEETEHHLQRALSAQQVYGTSEALTIPIPEVEDDLNKNYDRLYGTITDFKPPKQYVHVQVACGMEQEIPDYDMDSEDEAWLNKQAKKMEVTPLQFENMMDRLEKGSGQMVVTLQEAKALLKEDDDLIIAVYDYWLNKRLRTQHKLIPTVKTEKRDGSSTSDPYVAFRRRTEKMQTRKNRKNDEVSYEKMLKLRRDLNKALTILELMKRREKSKKELVQLTIEVYEKRHQRSDWDGKMLSEALAKAHTLPSFVPIQATQYSSREWQAGREGGYVRKKREYKKRKHKQPTTTPAQPREPAIQLPQYNEVDILHTDTYTSEEEALSPVSPSDHETDDDPDGIYAFRRKANCYYHAPLSDGLGNWPWCGKDEGGLADRRYRYSLTSLSAPRRCIGFARRRYGRGGRLLLDRASTEWDNQLTDLDLTSNTATPGPTHLASLLRHIKENRFTHFRPRTPTEDASEGGSLSPATSTTPTPEFNAESFHNHQEQLLAMQRQQQEALLKQESADLDASFELDHSFSSQPTSRFTLDSATARFAASAVCSSKHELISQNSSTSGASGSSSSNLTSSIATTFTNGPTVNSKAIGLSTSPQASVLQLNFPLSSSSMPSEVHHSLTASSSSASASLPSLPSVSSLVSSSHAMSSSATSFIPSLTTSLPPSVLASSLASSLLVANPASSSAAAAPAATSSPAAVVSIATGSTGASPVIATRAVTPAAMPTVLKLAATPNSQNDSIPKDSYDVNNIVSEQVVAMEVT